MRPKKKKYKPVYYAGLSGLVLPVPKYKFPPEHKESSRLTYYSTFFNSIEINSSFYKLPLQRTIKKWTEQVPGHFKFTFKLWQEISHADNLNFKEKDVSDFFNAIDAAASKKACVLIQFPPSFGSVNLSRLEVLLQVIDKYNKGKEWKIAVELRNRSWYTSETYDMLNDHGAAMVIHDMVKAPSPMIITADFIYVRFHGPEPRYSGSYSDHFLSEYSTFIKEWMEEGKTVYSYFNNTMGSAFKNQETLLQFVTNPF